MVLYDPNISPLWYGDFVRGLLTQCAFTNLPRRSEVIRDHQRHNSIVVMLSGWGATYIISRDGRRQITGFALPGDIIGLSDLYQKQPSEFFNTLTAAQVALIDRRFFLQYASQFPHSAYIIALVLGRQYSILRQNLVNLGRHNSLERTAHLISELWWRLTCKGDTQKSEFDFPLTQDDLADALGLSAIHVNRVLRNLKISGVLSLERRRVTIHDPIRLYELGHFDGRYLNWTNAHYQMVSA